jgi:3',5'-cyclic AMP phosphodiesterase CpdA
MKTRILFIAVLLVLSVNAVTKHESMYRIAVLSDVHVMAPELVEQGGSEYQKYLDGDRKLLSESLELLDSACSNVMKWRAQIILITGDLTKDGEKVSHKLLADNYLRKLEEGGARVFVVPGNHDVNNPRAVIFKGDTKERTATVTKEEFAEIYRDYGYGEAIARDANSLSYVAQLDERTRLIAIDACRYEDNDFDKDRCVTAGRIKDSTMDFISREARRAKADGCKVIAMMHHGVVRHWTLQDRMMKEYLVDDWKKRSRQLSKLGIKVVFTGHFHANDVASMSFSGRQISDVETGSTVSYPHPYRLIDVSGDKMIIRTKRIESLNSMKDGNPSLTDKSKAFAKTILNGTINRTLGSEVPAEDKKEVSEVLGEAYLMHLKGDENPDEEFRLRLNSAAEKVKKYSHKYASMINKVAASLTTDEGEDNDLVLEY